MKILLETGNYRVWITDEKRIEMNRDVEFHEVAGRIEPGRARRRKIVARGETSRAMHTR